jgi:hypothetical protein
VEELAAAVNPGWRKSSHSNGGAAGCVEASDVPGAVLVRDTQQFGAGPVLQVTPKDWRRFTSVVRADSALG